jgi:hypothetical protein
MAARGALRVGHPYCRVLLPGALFVESLLVETAVEKAQSLLHRQVPGPVREEVSLLERLSYRI